MLGIFWSPNTPTPTPTTAPTQHPPQLNTHPNSYLGITIKKGTKLQKNRWKVAKKACQGSWKTWKRMRKVYNILSSRFLTILCSICESSVLTIFACFFAKTIFWNKVGKLFFPSFHFCFLATRGHFLVFIAMQWQKTSFLVEWEPSCSETS